MPGRGHTEDFLKSAAKNAKDIIEEYFEDASDECRAAVIKGVFDIYAHNVVPGYMLETKGEY